MVDAEGIPRLVSIFANSGGGHPAEKITRKNAAICLAKLARNAKYKEVREVIEVIEVIDMYFKPSELL